MKNEHRQKLHSFMEIIRYEHIENLKQFFSNLYVQSPIPALRPLTKTTEIQTFVPPHLKNEFGDILNFLSLITTGEQHGECHIKYMMDKMTNTPLLFLLYLVDYPDEKLFFQYQIFDGLSNSDTQNLKFKMKCKYLRPRHIFLNVPQMQYDIKNENKLKELMFTILIQYSITFIKLESCLFKGNIPPNIFSLIIDFLFYCDPIDCKIKGVDDDVVDDVYDLSHMF